MEGYWKKDVDKPNGYIACICEGTAEREIINILLDNDKLIFRREDIIENEPLNCRSPKKFQTDYLGKAFDKPISVFRILDSRRERFELGKAYKHKVDVINVITAPEIEMLIIISEGLFDKYQKVKSVQKPSQFCNRIKKFKTKDIKSKEFIQSYFSNVDDLVSSLNEYKRLSDVKNTEICLADLLKK